MGIYTYWRFRAHIKPEYVSLVEHYMHNNEWLEPVPDFIAEWRGFLKNIDLYDIFGYHYVGANGGDGHFGYHRSFQNGIWCVSAGTKNVHKELEVFFTRVLVKLSSCIEECSITSDFTLDNRDPKMFVDDEYSHDEYVTRYSDTELRNTSWRKLTFF